MFAIILKWFKLTNLSSKQTLKILLIIFFESIIYIFNPVAYANIVSAISSQNPNLARIWALTFFLTQILGHLLLNIKSNSIVQTKDIIKNNLTSKTNLCTNQIDIVTNYADTLSEFFITIIKISSIVITSIIYSFILTAYTIIAIIICVLSSTLLSHITKHKSSSINNHNINPQTFIDIIWNLLTTILTLYLIKLTSSQEISISTFLLISSFVNTHLIKPNFNISLISKTRSLKTILSNNE